MPQTKLNAVTTAHCFERVSIDGDMLFSVCEGVDLRYAFENLEALVSAARDNIYMLAESPGGGDASKALWAPVHILNIAENLIRSMQRGNSEQARRMSEL